jgi:hypothetical protein
MRRSPKRFLEFEDGAHAGDRAVVVHELAEDAARVEAREDGQVDRRLGVAGTLEHPTWPGPERENVSGAREFPGL